MRAMVNHRTKPKKTGSKERKGRSVSWRPELLGKKGMLFLEDDDLDTGEELPIIYLG